MLAYRTLLAAAALGLAAPAAFADVDLLAAWEAAQQHDSIFAAARAERAAGEARAEQGKALLLPTVTVSGSVGYANGKQSTTGAQFTAPGFGTANGVDFRTDIHDGTATGWRVTALQPLYNAELSARARQLALRADLADLEYHAAQQELMLRTARLYFEVLLAGDALREIEQQAAATERAFEVARANFEEGKAPVTDRNEAQARYDEIVAREALARDDLLLKQAAFTDLTGLPGDRLKRMPSDAPMRAFDAGALDPWLAKAGKDSPMIGVGRVAQDIAAQEARKHETLAAPTLSLVAQAGGDRLSGSGTFGTSSVVSSTNGVVGLQLAVPIYEGGLRTAKNAEALALVEKARADVETTRKAVILQARSAWLGAASGLARIRAGEQTVASAADRLDATRTGHEVGARTTLDLLNAEADLHRAERELMQAKYQLLLDRLTLAKAAGELTTGDLESANAHLASGPM